MPTLDLTGVLKDSAGTSYNFSGTLDSFVAEPAPLVTSPAANPPPVEPDPVTPPAVETGTIPLSRSSSLFASNLKSGPTNVLNNGTLANRTIDQHSEPAAISMGNNSTLRRVSLGGAVREGVRIGGGKYTIEECWLEAKGSGNDHADVIQAYAGPNGGGPLDLTIRNSVIRAYNEAATAGLFVADKVFGKVTLDNVVFWGGPFGLALYSDVRTIDVYAKDVFFVEPFGWRAFDFRNAGGKVVIKQWENVRKATIVDGKLIPGEEIKQP